MQRLEVTSFVRADVIPQLADGAEVLARMDVPDDVAVTVLIPNERGLDNALAQRDRFHEVNCFLSASRDAQPQERQPLDRGVAERPASASSAAPRADGLRAEGVISRQLRLPLRGRRSRPSASSRSPTGSSRPAPREIGFGDTTGMANPVQVGEFFAAAREALPGVELTAHFHNTRGQGLANVVAALEAGCDSFESSFGELGGCPVPPGATGNIATEDLVSMLHEMGIETGDRPRRRCSTPRATSPASSAGRSAPTRSSPARSSGTVLELSPVLIANRGEIAVRVARTVARAGPAHRRRRSPTPDAGALHVDVADDAVRIGSYLAIDEVIEAARRTGAALDPPRLRLPQRERRLRASRGRRPGSTWIGPPPAAIELMGDKGRAKDAAAAAGVPVVPAGDDGGFPVVVKAVAGGGGKGMRVVRSAAELEAATAAAQREAKAAFGDDRVIVER